MPSSDSTQQPPSNDGPALKPALLSKPDDAVNNRISPKAGATTKCKLGFFLFCIVGFVRGLA